MKWSIESVLTLPYRLWLLALDKNMWCDECHSIVSGGFGSINDGERTFICIDCAHKEHVQRTNDRKLQYGNSFDPKQQEEFNE